MNNTIIFVVLIVVVIYLINSSSPKKEDFNLPPANLYNDNSICVDINNDKCDNPYYIDVCSDICRKIKEGNK